MDSSVDFGDLLEKWPYDPDNNVRKVRTREGREVLQVRLPLGIEQYELTGRPDGQRPFGKESLLLHHLERRTAAERSGDRFEFSLNSEECEELFAEAMLYYYRYLHLFQVRDWAGVVRDTARNLQLFDLIHGHAVDEDDQEYLEQWRPYLLRMNGAAGAMIEIERNHPAQALHFLNAAIAKIEALEDLDDETFEFERQRSLEALQEITAQIEDSQPLSELDHLEKELLDAIESQRFERAAVLRDQIRALRKGPVN